MAQKKLIKIFSKTETTEADFPGAWEKITFGNAHRDQIDWSRFSLYLAFGTSGTSKRAWEHHNQFAENADPQNQYLKKYDFGSKEANQEAYGSEVPPSYDLTLIKEKGTIWVGEFDHLTQRADMEYLGSQLENGEVIFVPKWGHHCVIVGVRSCFHDQILPKLEEHIAA